MPGINNQGGGKEPHPRDEISSIAGRILGAKSISDDLTKIESVSAEKFNSLLADARALAGFVLNADPKAGPNAAER